MADHLLIGCEVLTLLSAVGIVFSRSVFTSVLLFLVCCLGIVGIFGALSAPFLLISQIAVYGGGIAVLFLFAVMLSGNNKINPDSKRSFAGLIPAALFFWFLAGHSETSLITSGNQQEFTAGYTGTLMADLFLFPFELGGILLLVSLIAAIFISVQKPEQ